MTDFFEPAERGVQHASLRAANRRAVLTAIAFNQGVSNAEVSRRTGLAPQTASAIVAELEDEGLVTRGEVLRGRRGQPATPLYLDYSGAYAIGCEISWHYIEVVLINVGSVELARYRRDYAWLDAGSIIAEASGAIASLVEKIPPDRRDRLAGIGLASPGNIDKHIAAAGAPADQAARWVGVDLRALLEEATGIACSWFNDGTAACFSGMVMSSPPRPPSLLHLFVSTFLGAGLTVEHSLREGPTGNAANLGSMIVHCAADGRRRQAFELTSITALGERLASAGLSLPPGNPVDWPWSEWEPHVADWIDVAACALSEVIFNTTAVLELDMVIIDSTAPPGIVQRLVHAIEVELDALAKVYTRRPNVRAGELGSRAGPLGAAQLRLFRKHFSRDLGHMLADQV